MPENNAENPQKILNASMAMGPMKTEIKKPSTPKPAEKSSMPNSSGATNNQLRETKIVKCNLDDTKNRKQ